MSIVERFANWVGVDEPWQRPRPTSWRPDVILVVVVLIIGVLDVIVVDSVWGLDSPDWAVYAAMAAAVLPLLVRRRWPLWVMAYGGAFLFTMPYIVPEVNVSTAVQFACFFAIFSGVAWARDRRTLMIVATGVLLLLVGWLTWQVAVGSGYQRIVEAMEPTATDGLLSPLGAYSLQSVYVNLAYFIGALTLGQLSWRQARDQARVEAQAEQLATQSVELRDQAVVNERLRIARELHDVVAHHVSVMGIQAAGARRVLEVNPEAAADALVVIEDSSRRAVTEMRGLLGTLRADGEGREPDPHIRQLGQLVGAANSPLLAVDHTITTDVDDAVENLPAPVALALYRVAQEALTNVRKHSTAKKASVALRIDRSGEGRFAEVEITDDGRPRVGTSGTGLGQEGIRERVNALGGTVEMGPRTVGGYRVRARIPLHTPEAS